MFGSMGLNFEQLDEKMSEEDIDSEDFITNLIEGKRSKENEKIIMDEDDPNYGSNYCDWSPDIEDYI